MLKKVLYIAAAVALTLVIFGAGFAFAQYGSASAAASARWNAQGGGFPGGMMGGRWTDGGAMMAGRGGYGGIHNYVEQALAEKLGLTETQIDEQETAGKTLPQIALDNGVAEADLTAFLTEIHTTAFDKAVADGVLTREQADLMLQNMAANGFAETCPMNGTRPQDGSGYRGGHGGMMGQGYRWNVTPTPAP